MSREKPLLILLAFIISISIAEKIKPEEPLRFKDVLSHLGVTKKEVPTELTEVVKSIMKRYNEGGRDKSEFEINVEALQNQWEVVRDKIHEFINSTSYKMYSDIPLTMLGHFGERLLNIATVEEVKKIYQIYMNQPELFKSFAKANQKLIWEKWEMLLGNSQKLDEGLDTFLYYADFVEGIKNLVAPFREDRLKQLAEQENNKLGNEEKPLVDSENKSTDKKAKSEDKKKKSNKEKSEL